MAPEGRRRRSYGRETRPQKSSLNCAGMRTASRRSQRGPGLPRCGSQRADVPLLERPVRLSERRRGQAAAALRHPERPSQARRRRSGPAQAGASGGPQKRGRDGGPAAARRALPPGTLWRLGAPRMQRAGAAAYRGTSRSVSGRSSSRNREGQNKATRCIKPEGGLIYACASWGPQVPVLSGNCGRDCCCRDGPDEDATMLLRSGRQRTTGGS